MVSDHLLSSTATNILAQRNEQQEYKKKQFAPVGLVIWRVCALCVTAKREEETHSTEYLLFFPSSLLLFGSITVFSASFLILLRLVSSSLLRFIHLIVVHFQRINVRLEDVQIILSPQNECFSVCFDMFFHRCDKNNKI